MSSMSLVSYPSAPRTAASEAAVSRCAATLDADQAMEQRLLAAVQRGLPLVPRPYAEIGQRVGLCEADVIERLARWSATGVINRLGVVVRHRVLGYEANAMVVFDIPDDRVSEVGATMASFSCVTLCYRRPRRGQDWPYNLFCMIHGRDRAVVEGQVEALVVFCGLVDVPRAVLFSRRCFKQRGAIYR
ncbi:MAG: AsnC family protein [Methylotetracoccus sp.]